MENKECFLCQKQNCELKCRKCGIYYCSESHYSSHIYRRKETDKSLSEESVKKSNKPQTISDLVSTNGDHNGVSNVNHNDDSFICLPYRIEKSEKFGRYFVATRDIKPLELILVDQPGVVGPATKTKPVCIVCLNPAKGQFRSEKVIVTVTLSIIDMIFYQK